MDKNFFPQEIERKEVGELIVKAQVLTNSHYEIQRRELMGENGEKQLKGLKEFKKELSKHIKTDLMSDDDIYKMAQKLVIRTVEKELKKDY